MKNLDLEAAQTAQAIIQATDQQNASEVGNLVTKALGVIQESGVYAGMLFLYSRTREADQKISEPVRAQLLRLTTLVGKSPPTPTESAKADAALKFLTDHICSDLDTLLLVKQLWEQTLIYTRYSAKARE